MSKISQSLIALLIAGVAVPLAAAPPKKISNPESIVEATADTVLLPSVGDGILVVKACSTCEPRSFRATQATLYLLGGRSLTLKELRAAVALSPHMNITLGVSPKTAELLTVEATPQSGAAPAVSAKPPVKRNHK